MTPDGSGNDCVLYRGRRRPFFTRAKAAGAQILIEIKTESYGGRGYTCKDLEGHIWSFGTFDPWQQA